MNPAVGYPRAMADCIVDLFSYRSCGTAQEFNEAASTASFSLVVLGDLDDEGYEVNRPDAAYAGPLAIGASGLVGDLRVRSGVVTWVGGTFEGPVRVDSEAELTLWGTTHEAPLRAFEGSVLTLDRVALTDDGHVVTEGAALLVQDVDWEGLSAPVLEVDGGSLTLERASLRGFTGNRPVVLVADAWVDISDSEACDNGAPVVEATCREQGQCTLDRVIVWAADPSRAALTLDRAWSLEHLTLVLDGEPRSATWGVDAASAQVEQVHVWPDDGHGLRDATPVPLFDASAFFTTPPWIRCPPAIPAPEPLGFDGDAVPGAYAPWSPSDETFLLNVARPFFTDPDRDGVPAMWDCYPGQDGLFGVELPDDWDNDCDGVRLCGVDHDGDGFTVPGELGADGPCPPHQGAEDLDDHNECNVPRGEPTDPTCPPDDTTGTTTTHTGDSEAPPGVLGWSGSGCDAAGGAAGWAWLAAAALLRRRAR